MSTTKTKCTAVTTKGAPCKAWAIHESSPPRCAVHAGLARAPKGNTNAVTHGFYQRQFTAGDRASLFNSAAESTLVEEAVLLRLLLRRLKSYLDDDELPLASVKTVAPLIISGTRALTYVEKHLPDPNAIDWDAILDEVGEDLDWDI